MGDVNGNGKRKPGRPARVSGGLQVFGATRVVIEAEGKGGTAGRWVLSAPDGTLDVILELGEGGKPDRVRITREGFVARQFGGQHPTVAARDSKPQAAAAPRKRAPGANGKEPGFWAWMSTQTERTDLVGQLSRIMMKDPGWPKKGFAAHRESQAKYVDALAVKPEHRGHKLQETFSSAWREYEAQRKSAPAAVAGAPA